jgi:predicted phage replisome organizer
MSDVKWIKVSTNMFDSSRKIKQIELMPEGDTILVIWLKLLLLAGNINDGGQIYLTPEIPYTDEMLANELRRPLNTVRMALNLFVKFGMIEIVDDILQLSSWEKYQSIDKLAEIREKNRLSQQRSRARRKELQAASGGDNDMSRDSHMTCHCCHGLEKEEELEEEKEYSFIHSGEKNDDLNDLSTAFSTGVDTQRVLLGGELGKGVVLLSQEQMDDLLDKLSLDEFNHYVSVVADCILKGKKYTKKTHYQAIIEMASKDRKIK